MQSASALHATNLLASATTALRNAAHASDAAAPELARGAGAEDAVGGAVADSAVGPALDAALGVRSHATAKSGTRLALQATQRLAEDRPAWIPETAPIAASTPVFIVGHGN